MAPKKDERGLILENEPSLRAFIVVRKEMRIIFVIFFAQLALLHPHLLSWKSTLMNLIQGLGEHVVLRVSTSGRRPEWGCFT